MFKKATLHCVTDKFLSKKTKQKTWAPVSQRYIIFGSKKTVSLTPLCICHSSESDSMLYLSAGSPTSCCDLQHNVLLHLFLLPVWQTAGSPTQHCVTLILRKSPWELNYLHFSSILACTTGPRWIGFMKKMTKNLVTLHLLKCVK